ncbi:ribosylnicotinamide kinase [Coemansia sp. RSA 552]|nr:ribosylnicotinamide kinase [Coemansia sp. RSA 552]
MRYFAPNSQIPLSPNTGDQDWDCPEAFDMDKLIQTIRTTREQIEHPSDAVQRAGGPPGLQYSLASMWANPPEDTHRLLSPEALDSIRSSALSRLGVGSIAEIPFSIILVDGILLFYDSVGGEGSPGEECDAGIFVYANYHTLKQRREARSGYATKDGIWVDPPGYFDAVVWPGFLKYHRTLVEACPQIADKTPQPPDDGGPEEAVRHGDIALCSSDMPFERTLRVCVESVIREWDRRQVN